MSETGHAAPAVVRDRRLPSEKSRAAMARKAEILMGVRLDAFPHADRLILPECGSAIR